MEIPAAAPPRPAVQAAFVGSARSRTGAPVAVEARILRTLLQRMLLQYARLAYAASATTAAADSSAPQAAACRYSIGLELGHAGDVCAWTPGVEDAALHAWHSRIHGVQASQRSRYKRSAKCVKTARGHLSHGRAAPAVPWHTEHTHWVTLPDGRSARLRATFAAPLESSLKARLAGDDPKSPGGMAVAAGTEDAPPPPLPPRTLLRAYRAGRAAGSHEHVACQVLRHMFQGRGLSATGIAWVAWMRAATRARAQHKLPPSGAWHTTALVEQQCISRATVCAQAGETVEDRRHIYDACMSLTCTRDVPTAAAPPLLRSRRARKRMTWSTHILYTQWEIQLIREAQGGTLEEAEQRLLQRPTQGIARVRLVFRGVPPTHPIMSSTGEALPPVKAWAAWALRHAEEGLHILQEFNGNRRIVWSESQWEDAPFSERSSSPAATTGTQQRDDAAADL